MLYRADIPWRNLGGACVEGESDKKTKFGTDGGWFGIDHAKGTSIEAQYIFLKSRFF